MHEQESVQPRISHDNGPDQNPGGSKSLTRGIVGPTRRMRGVCIINLGQKGIPAGLALQHDVIPTLERYEPRSRDFAGQIPASLRTGHGALSLGSLSARCRWRPSSRRRDSTYRDQESRAPRSSGGSSGGSPIVGENPDSSSRIGARPVLCLRISSGFKPVSS